MPEGSTGNTAHTRGFCSDAVFRNITFSATYVYIKAPRTSVWSSVYTATYNVAAAVLANEALCTATKTGEDGNVTAVDAASIADAAGAVFLPRDLSWSTASQGLSSCQKVVQTTRRCSTDYPSVLPDDNGGSPRTATTQDVFSSSRSATILLTQCLNNATTDTVRASVAVSGDNNFSELVFSQPGTYVHHKGVTGTNEGFKSSPSLHRL